MTRQVDLRQLRYFVAVAEHLHFARAAASLGMAQPPLTQQIQKLEQRLGCALFTRKPRRTALTEAGRVLLKDAVRLLRECDDAIERTRSAGRGETGRLTVGTPPSVMLTALPAVIRRYRQQYPEVQFALREMSTSAVAAALAAGTIDVGLLRETARVGEVEVQVVLREPVVAVLPATHPLATRARLSLRHMASEPFVLFPRRLGDEFYDRLLSYCVDAGFTPRVVQEATQWQSVVTFVETGLGVSLAPGCVERFNWPGVAYRRLPGLTTSIGVCAPRAESSPAAAAFVEAVRASRLGT
jgi:DNA-binding transcriptional LysR family regulator